MPTELVLHVQGQFIPECVTHGFEVVFRVLLHFFNLESSMPRHSHDGTVLVVGFLSFHGQAPWCPQVFLFWMKIQGRLRSQLSAGQLWWPTMMPQCPWFWITRRSEAKLWFWVSRKVWILCSMPMFSGFDLTQHEKCAHKNVWPKNTSFVQVALLLISPRIFSRPCGLTEWHSFVTFVEIIPTNTFGFLIKTPPEHAIYLVRTIFCPIYHCFCILV